MVGHAPWGCGGGDLRIMMMSGWGGGSGGLRQRGGVCEGTVLADGSPKM